MDFETYNNLIESTLAFLGLNPAEARSSEKGQWVLYNGDTEIYIDMWEQKSQNAWLYFESEEPLFIFQVISPVCYLPTVNTEQFYQELLHNNLNMLYASYTINKEEMHICLRTRDTNEDIYDMNLLMYVVLHELAHLCNYDKNGYAIQGHGEEFRMIFKFLVIESIKLNIYEYENYGEKPKEYCGIQISTNILPKDEMVYL